MIYRLSILFFLFFNQHVSAQSSNKRTKSEGVKTYDYSGTNALFIEKTDSLRFKWLTNIKDSSYYCLRNNHKILAEGNTNFVRTHSISINVFPKDTLHFSFGAKTKLHNVVVYPNPKKEKSTFKNVDSIYVVGDVHGKYKKLKSLLIKANIINDDLQWKAGKASVVFLGDLFDRGSQVTKLLWFIYQLEKQAKKYGGNIHVVLGNHEIMVMSKDLKYVSLKERSIATNYNVTYDYLFHPKKSVLGNWLKTKASVLKINDLLFAHGGVINLKEKSIKNYNSKVYKNMNSPIFLDLNRKKPDTLKYKKRDWYNMIQFFYNNKSPFWFRGYVSSDNFDKELTKTLNKFKAKIHIVAHTPLKTISQKYDGKLIATDLYKPATQLLLLKKEKKGYQRFVINASGLVAELE